MEENTFHEINKYKDTLFPIEVYHVSTKGVSPNGRGIQNFHWHDELQFTLVIHGNLTLQVDGVDYHLTEGDAAFINSGMIHAVTNLFSDGSYTSLNFPYKILSFFSGSRMEKEYVLPFVTGSCIPVIVLHKIETAQKSTIDLLQEINDLWDDHLYLKNEYFISIKIVTLWYTFLPNLQSDHNNTVSVNLLYRQRLQLMLSFIYEHFSEDIVLADIANVASVSIGECCRIFRKHMQTTPYQFLTEYRIRKSAEILSGDLSITEIAGHCGYNQVSNYIAKFKVLMGCTPAQWRKHNENG